LFSCANNLQDVILFCFGGCHSDYRPMEHLDRYENVGIDEDFEEDLTEEEALAARRAAELDLARRDAREGRLAGRRRLPAALDGGSE
jgi:Mini-chromosome maintenance protein 2